MSKRNTLEAKNSFNLYTEHNYDVQGRLSYKNLVEIYSKKTFYAEMKQQESLY